MQRGDTFKLRVNKIRIQHESGVWTVWLTDTISANVCLHRRHPIPILGLFTWLDTTVLVCGRVH